MKDNWLLEIRNRYANDRYFYEVFEQQVYERALDGNPKVILDIGARFGEFSFYVYEKAGKIYAVEPEPRNFGELRFNVDFHKLNKIKYFNFAISDREGTCPLRIASDNGGHDLVDQATANFITVPTRSLNYFLEENNIDHVDVLKIDIESHETQVFSAPDADKALQKIDFIIGEHGNLDLLEKHGFEVKTQGTIWTAKKK